MTDDAREPSADELTLVRAAFAEQAKVYRQRAVEHRSRGAYYCAELADDIAEKAEMEARLSGRATTGKGSE